MINLNLNSTLNNADSKRLGLFVELNLDLD